MKRKNDCGIPYKGSKRKLAVEICKLLKGRHPHVDNFYDLFGGGGAVALTAQKFFKNVIYNEIDTAICELLKHLQYNDIPDEWWQFVSKDDFEKYKDEPTAFGGMVKTCYSFGNNKRQYLFNAENERQKSVLHQLVVNGGEEWRKKASENLGIELPELKGNTRKERRLFLRSIITKSVSDRCDLQSLESLERLERLERLEILNKDYKDISFEDNSLIYCDIPYKNTDNYGFDFNHDEFYEWALKQKFPVYISEYQMPNEFIEVGAKTHNTTLSQTKVGKRVERIFWNGKGKHFETKLF